eukprot:scaffold266704_cov22-Tisochrysis_lutea.AAC.1
MTEDKNKEHNYRPYDRTSNLRPSPLRSRLNSLSFELPVGSPSRRLPQYALFTEPHRAELQHQGTSGSERKRAAASSASITLSNGTGGRFHTLRLRWRPAVAVDTELTVVGLIVDSLSGSRGNSSMQRRSASPGPAAAKSTAWTFCSHDRMSRSTCSC